jgi:phage anti-repressor protein
MQLSLDRVNQLTQSPAPYPVDFDHAWKWCGYSRKAHAKRALEAYLIKGSDFLQFEEKVPTKGRPSENIRLSIEGFKMFAMIARTPQGRKVREYFIECERQLKASQTILPAIQPAAKAKNGKELNDALDVNLQIMEDFHAQVAAATPTWLRWLNLEKQLSPQENPILDLALKTLREELPARNWRQIHCTIDELPSELSAVLDQEKPPSKAKEAFADLEATIAKYSNSPLSEAGRAALVVLTDEIAELEDSYVRLLQDEGIL